MLESNLPSINDREGSKVPADFPDVID